MGTKKFKTNVLIALVASIISICLQSYLALNHYKLKYGIAEGKSVCNINSHLNCDVVATSPYASLFKMPLAMWATSTHVLLCLMLGLLLLGLMSHPKRVLRYSFWLASFILLMSVIMGGVSAFLLSTYCLFCVGAYVCSIIIWLALFFAVRNTDMEESAGTNITQLFKEERWVLICALLIPGLSYLGNAMIIDSYGLKELPALIADATEAWKSAPVKTFDPEVGLTAGASAASAQVTVVEFADYLCPHCRAAAEPLHNFIEGHPGMRLVVKMYPLDGTCNNDIKQHGDGLRCSLASAAYCADQVGKKGWPAHEYIFEHQMSWSLSGWDSQLHDMDAELGLDDKAMQDCLQSAGTHDHIVSVASEGHGIEGTPAIFVDGRSLRYGQVPAILESVVNEIKH